MAESRVIDDSGEFVPMPRPGQVLAAGRERGLDAFPFQFRDIRSLAQGMLKKAQEEADRKLEAAKRQIAALEKQAFDKGYREALPKAEKDGFAKGEKDGLAAAEAKVAAAAEAERESFRRKVGPVSGMLERLAALMGESRQKLLAQAENDLLRLVLDLARRLVGHELSIDPEAIRPLARECIGLVVERSSLAVRVNPEDLGAMRETLPELAAIFTDLGTVEIEADPAIERGGLLATTREAEVDMRLSTRLAAFEEALLGFSGEAAAPPWNHPPAPGKTPAAIPPPPAAPPPPAGGEKPGPEGGGE
ncbi:MAG: flagellar assembly protein FliH [Planctomycetota bacterium]|jgi:flagellar assembly protein FliH|nr:flagellar assembly protein FliH [Planctomycetota bacterium]